MYRLATHRRDIHDTSYLSNHETHHPFALSSTSNRDIGLGVGLAFGIPILLLVGLVLYSYIRTRREDKAAVKAMRDVEMGNNPTAAQSDEKQSVVSTIERRIATEDEEAKEDSEEIRKPEAAFKVAQREQAR